jgi:hypothetical protein
MSTERRKEIKGQVVMAQGALPDDLKALIEEAGTKLGSSGSEATKMEWEVRPKRKGLIDSPDIWNFLVTFYTGVASGMLANAFTQWLEELDGRGPLHVETAGEKTIIHCRGAKIIITAESE